MDKKLMLAVAGAGKTTYIINKVCTEYRKVLVITYTDANYNNIIFKLREQNDEVIPDGIIVYKYFTFLYRFCYKPLQKIICNSLIRFVAPIMMFVLFLQSTGILH